MKVDYSQAKIYKITNDFNNDIWIRTTCDTLVKKFSVHKAEAIRNVRKDCIIQNTIREYGFDRFRIQLVEDFPCEDVYQLRQRQGHHIREMKAINKYADSKDYYEQNKEQINEHTSEIVVCECGCKTRRDNISKHKKTKNHLKLIAQKQDSNN